jgi:hypothetical protein
MENRRATFVWDLRESNISDFLLKLSTTYFDTIKLESSVDNMCLKFYDLLRQCMCGIPCDIVYFSSTDKPWMTPVLKSLINKRWRAFREKNWVVYKHYKSKVQVEILKAKRLWCKKQSKTSRGLWNVVRMFRGSSTKDPWRRLCEEAGGYQELLAQLTSQFSSNFNTDDVELLPLSNQKWNLQVSPESVYDQLLRLHSRKAMGPDQIPLRLLKEGAQFLCYPIADIFNLSILSKQFPVCFKRAHVCPIPKLSIPSVRDFRPISLLTPLSKVFERIVFENIKHDLFACYGAEQHAYRPLGSTSSALIDICEHVTAALDSRNISHVNLFCLDLSKAFDTLSHHRLINFLSVHGINHGFLQWLCSYLSSRTMCVKISNNFGPIVKIPSGVPQGSVLGPFLFAAYMGSINFDKINVKCVKYADDVTLIEPLSRNQVSSVTLDDCMSIFEREGLFVNRMKCKLLHICFCRTLQSGCKMTDCGFTQVSSLRVLGFTFTDRFTWDMHISHVLKTASQRLHIIRCMKQCLSLEELMLIYHAIITSVLLYASPVFGSLSLTLLNKLERFQRRAHRIICGRSSCDCNGFPSLCGRFEDAATELLLRAEANGSHPLHRYMPRRMSATRQFRNPVCFTSRRLNSFIPWACRLINSCFTK